MSRKKLAIIASVTLVFVICLACIFLRDAAKSADEPAEVPAETGAATVPSVTLVTAVSNVTQAPSAFTEPTQSVPLVAETTAVSMVTTNPSTQPTVAATQPPKPTTQLTTPATKPPIIVPTAPEVSTTPTVLTTPNTTPTDNFPAATDNTMLFFMESTQNIGVGSQAKAEYVYYGSGKLTWYVSHPYCISVDQNGLIAPLYEGNYRVYVTDGEYTAVTDVWAPQTWYGSPHAFYFESAFLELQVGKSALIPVTDGTSFGTTTYTSSDLSVVKVSGAYITAVAPGTAIITAHRYGATAKLLVTVVSKTEMVMLDILEGDVSLYDQETVQLNHKYTGTETLEWSSSDHYVASVDENGFVTAVGEGSCDIYLSDGVYADQCRVTVSIDPNVKVTELKITSDNGPIYDGVIKYKGDYITFKVGVSPSNASRDTRVIVSDSTIIAVSRTYSGSDTIFRLDFKKAGSCVVEIISGDNAVTSTYTVNVKEDYAINPGSGLLTPEQFVDCYNYVLMANGMSLDYMPTGYLVLTLNPNELTWNKARKGAEGLGHHWWSIGYRHMIITYEGTNEFGQHIFYERGC